MFQVCTPMFHLLYSWQTRILELIFCQDFHSELYMLYQLMYKDQNNYQTSVPVNGQNGHRIQILALAL